jgi:tetratricopeptide (TPR) repeat protein
MSIDPENVVVKLCVSGMQAETEGRLDDAKRLYEQAWNGHSTDYEACIAAHYLARRQSSIEDEFEWNKVALARARCVDSDLIGGFYASLYLNIGHSYEKLGNLNAAREHLQSAQHHLDVVPDGPYKEIIRGGIENALSRTRQAELSPEPG